MIGAGIVGNSLAFHLAELGWRDLVLLDKGPLPNPGGSTGHASNFIFPVDHSKEMTQLTLDSMRQYQELGVFTESGGVEVARTEERMQELHRRVTSAIAWGIEPVSIVSPAEVKELVPFLDETVILGGFWSPTVGVVDSLRAGTIMRERAQDSGALTVSANTEVLGIDVEHGRVRRLRTTRGDVEADYVVICCGCWSPRLARMAGASIPLTPAVHQMIDVGPVPRFEGATGMIEFPIVRDMDTNMYERQDGTGLEIGSYAHRPILHDPDEIPSIEEAALSPTEFPFTQDDFTQQMEHALELMPEIVGDETVGIKYAINGLLSLTPDGLPLLGETPEVKGLWSAAAVWVKEGPGVGKSVAEWMVRGEPEIDLQSSDIARFYEHQKTATHVKARAAEGFNKTYGIVHPSEQWESNRPVRLSPFYAREVELGAVFFETAGWERPHWYESNARLLEEYGDRVTRREAEWDSRWWSPISNAEHLAMRDRAAMFDLTAFWSSTSSDRVRSTPCSASPCGRWTSRSAGSSTRRCSRRVGGFKSDLTIMRLGDEHFRVVTGGAHGMADLKWFARPSPRGRLGAGHRPHLGMVHARALGAACTRHPRRRDERRRLARGLPVRDLQDDRGRHRCACSPRGSPTSATSAGSCTCRSSRARGCGTSSAEAGAPHGIVPAGIGVYGTTGRLEKCYRAFGFELDDEYDVVEAGMAWGKVKDEDFVGKEAHVAPARVRAGRDACAR